MDRLDHPESDEPAGMTLAVMALLRGIPEDAWTDGPTDDVALRLHRLRVFISTLQFYADACEQTLIDSMEGDSMIARHVGQVRRVEKTSSTWIGEHASSRLRDDLTQAVANNVATDIATGGIDPMKRNIARAAMSLALEAIPSFSSLNKAGRERLGLHLDDYRTFATHYRIVIEATDGRHLMEVIGEGEALLAFYAALASVESVRKSETADMGRYVVKYASLNAVHAECERACELHKLVVVQEPTIRDGLFAVINTMIHADGSMVEMDPMCLPLPKEAQALGSATTYLRRYRWSPSSGSLSKTTTGMPPPSPRRRSPGRRTEAERMIRESIAQMDETTRRQFVNDFKVVWGVGLSDLPATKHGDALKWAKNWVAPGPDEVAANATDAAWVQEAQEAPT